jgi:hypothetical protein
VVGRVAKIEMIFQWRVGVGLSGEGCRWRWCRFNALVSAREGRQQDEALSEAKADVANSSWLHGKEA